VLATAASRSISTNWTSGRKWTIFSGRMGVTRGLTYTAPQEDMRPWNGVSCG
jgi:hypothetical protein